MAIGTFPTQEFATYADTQVAGALGAKKKYVVVKANENFSGAWCLYFFDGDQLQVIFEPGGGGTGPSPFTPTKEYTVATGGETDIVSTGIQTSFINLVFQGMTPLIEYNGALPVPGGQYKVGTDKITIGDAAGAGEIFTVIKFG